MEPGGQDVPAHGVQAARLNTHTHTLTLSMFVRTRAALSADLNCE